jgi:hypothetical protein
MRQSSLFIAIILVSLSSCIKPAAKSPVPIDGKWRMVTVADNFSGPTIIKPASITGDVDITFTSTTPTTGTFTGNTPTNQIFQNAYTIDDNQSLSIEALDMTKIAETLWGDAFVATIPGTHPYSFTVDGNLAINTGRKTLLFVRL